MVQQGFFLDEDEDMAPQEPANQKYSLRKPIVPYICSTQDDFHEERDFLMKNVFPQIDKICRNRGACFSPVDIRWTTADDSVVSGHLLKLNLDFICKCAPFFICLLGETYGPYRPEDSLPFPRKVPSKPEDIDGIDSWIDRNYLIAASAGYNWVLQEAHQNNSIPELEIIQAAFFNDNKHCHFYFRQPEHLDHKYGHLSPDEQKLFSVIHKPDSEYADLNIRDLKQRIVKKGLPVKYFRTFEELGNHVLKDWCAIIETLYPPLPFETKILGSEEYQEWIANETFADCRRHLFINSPECRSLMNEITDFANSISEDTILEEEEHLSIYRSYSVTSSLRKKATEEKLTKKQACAKYKSLMLLQGDRGCGKSTLIANWLRKYMFDFQNVKVIYQYIGSSGRSRDIAIFMRRCIEELRTEYLRPDSEIDGPKLLDDDIPWSFHDVAEAFVASLSLGPCVLVIDGLDEITSSLGITSREIKNFSWLPFPLPSQCRIICTTCRSDLSYLSLTKRTDVKLHAIPLFDNVKLRLNFLEDDMQQYFNHLKKLPGYEKQVSDIKLTNRPLFLSIMGTEMQSFEVYTDLEKYLDYTYDHCSSFRDLCVRCFNRWTREHSWQKECLFLESTDDEPELEFEGWVPDVLRLLAVARTGLTQSDLFALLEQLGYTGRKILTNFKWLQFKSCIGNLVYEKPDGLMQFSHHHIRETVEYILLHTLKPGATDVMTRTDPEKAWKEQKKKYHSQMAKFFMQQPFSQRVMEELPWQLMMAGDVDSLVKVLTDPIMIEQFLDNKKLNPSNKLELAYYWSLLKNLDVSAGKEYQKLLIKLGVLNMIYPDEKPTHADESNPENCSMIDDLPLSVITGTDGKSTPPLFTPVSIPTILSPPPTDREQLSVIEESMSTTDSEADKAEIKKEMDSKFESKPMTSSVKGEVIDTIFLTEAKARHDTVETEHGDKDDPKGDNLNYITKLTWLITGLLKDLGYNYVTEKIMLALSNKLDKSYPLSTETQLIHAKIQEQLGTYQTDCQRSEKWFRRSLRTVMNMSEIEEDNPYYMDIQNLKGRLLCSFGYLRLNEDLFDTADDLLSEGLDCAQECGNFTLRATILFNIGLLRTKQEDFLLAETSLRQALNMRELWYGKSHPYVSEVLFVLAGIMGNPRNRKGFNNLAAESLYRRTMKIQEECQGKDDLSVADTLFELGKLLQDETSFQAKSEAVRLLRRSLDIKTSKLGDEMPKQYQCFVCNKWGIQFRRPLKEKYLRDHVEKLTQKVCSSEDVICGKCRTKVCRDIKKSNVHVSDIEEGDASSDNIHSPKSISLTVVSTINTHSKCVICNNKKSRLNVIPQDARIQAFVQKGIFINSKNRCCSDHLVGRYFNEESLNVIESIGKKESTDFNRTDICDLLQNLRSFCKHSGALNFDVPIRLSNDDYFKLTGVYSDQFDTLAGSLTLVRCSLVRSVRTCLAVLLVKLRTGLSNDILCTLFNLTKPQIQRAVHSARQGLLDDFVKKHIGCNHISHEDFSTNHTTPLARKLFLSDLTVEDELESEQCILVLDGTYIYIQKSGDHQLQKKAYSIHKHRPLLKPMVIVGTDGYILSVIGPFYSNSYNNDASILKQCVSNNQDNLKYWLKEKDVLIVDRGFRDCTDFLKDHGFQVEMPAYLKKGNKQHSVDEANSSRLITKVRWVVESVNGRIKQWRFFDKVVHNYFIPYIGDFIQIVCAICNAFRPVICSRDPEGEILAEKMLERSKMGNSLQRYVDENNLLRKKSVYIPIDVAKDMDDFPRLDVNALREITLGVYQLKQAPGYTLQHLTEDGDYKMDICKDGANILRVRISSRHSNSVIHTLWIEYGQDSITGWYCTCKVGARVVGCCAHIASVLWYLCYRRHLGEMSSTKSATFGGNILDAQTQKSETDTTENVVEE